MEAAFQAVSEYPELSESNECIMKKFINTYKSLPELWNHLDPVYLNKFKKNEGYRKLLEIYKEIKPKATEVDVKKQINSLRSNYRRELNKVKASKQLGAAVYQPSSWKFYALSFLDDTEGLDDIHHKYDKQEVMSDEENSNKSETFNPCSASTSSVLHLPKKLKNSEFETSKPQFYQPIYEIQPMDSVNSTYKDEEYLNIAKVWAFKLKNLETMQRKFAEKAINDILFEADMGKLFMESGRINY